MSLFCTPLTSLALLLYNPAVMQLTTGPLTLPNDGFPIFKHSRLLSIQPLLSTAERQLSSAALSHSAQYPVIYWVKYITIFHCTPYSFPSDLAKNFSFIFYVHVGKIQPCSEKYLHTCISHTRIPQTSLAQVPARIRTHPWEVLYFKVFCLILGLNSLVFNCISKHLCCVTFQCIAMYLTDS